MTIDREELERLHKAATPGPWEIESDPYNAPFPAICEAGSPFEIASFTMGEDENENQANADIVTHLRNAVPDILALLDENAMLRERLEVVDGLSMEDSDGISCRDETIRLQDKRIAALAARVERLEADAARDHNTPSHNFCLDEARAALNQTDGGEDIAE